MKRVWFNLVFVLLLTSCGGLNISTRTPIESVTTVLNSRTPVPRKTAISTDVILTTATQKPTITTKKTNTITPTSTEPNFPSPEPNSTISQHCVVINQSSIPININGILALGNGLPDAKPYLLDLKSNKIYNYEFTINNPHLFLDYGAASPDGRWFAYIELLENTNISRLHLMSSALEEKTYLDLPKDWGKIVYWLDDQRILIATSQTLPEGIYPTGKMMILNPFLREWEILSPKLPFQISTDPSPWYYWPDNPIVIYNPALTRAVYLALSGFYLIDAKSLNVIMHIDTQDYGSRPQWAPEGDRFAMVIDNADYPISKPEIYLFNQDGQSKPITNIAKAFNNKNNESIQSFVWSPDGTKIAFSYFVRDFKDEHIAVVNVNTGQTIDYCLPSVGLPPIWSPDSNKIAFASGNSTDIQHRWRTVVLDLENEYAIQVADTMLPLGWMISP